MSFSVSEIIVCDTTQKVVALNWAYENDDGKLSNQWKLDQPYGDTPLSDCTDAVLLGWLQEQLPNTTAEFDRQIAAAKEAKEFEQTLKGYTPHPDGPPTPVTQEIVVPDGPETQESEPALPGKMKKGK